VGVERPVQSPKVLGFGQAELDEDVFGGSAIPMAPFDCECQKVFGVVHVFSWWLAVM
jgi:hypothetical protein